MHVQSREYHNMIIIYNIKNMKYTNYDTHGNRLSHSFFFLTMEQSGTFTPWVYFMMLEADEVRQEPKVNYSHGYSA